MRKSFRLFMILLPMLLLLPNVLANDLGQTFEEMLAQDTQAVSNLIGASTDEGGASDPYSYVRDPIVQMWNSTFNTNNGWFYVYIIFAIIMATIGLPFLVAGIAKFIFYFIAVSSGWALAGELSWVVFIIMFIVTFKYAPRKYLIWARKGIWVLVILLVILAILFILNMVNALPPWIATAL